MKQRIHRISAFVITLFVIYNTLLINGGRGPFTLYESYWACHCDDSPGIEQSKDIDPLKPSLIKRNNSKDSGASYDICHAPRISEESTVCKTKLPLRYINLLLSGMYIIDSPVYSPLSGLYFPFSNILPDLNYGDFSGFREELIYPPGHST